MNDPNRSAQNPDDPSELDAGWESQSPSRVPVSAVRGTTVRFGEEQDSLDDAELAAEPKPALPFRLGESLLGRRRRAGGVQGTTLSWDDLMAATKAELPALMAGAPQNPSSREELVALAHALAGATGDADALDALGVDSVLEALEREDHQGARTSDEPYERPPSSPEIVIEGELELGTALASFDHDD